VGDPCDHRTTAGGAAGGFETFDQVPLMCEPLRLHAVLPMRGGSGRCSGRCGRLRYVFHDSDLATLAAVGGQGRRPASEQTSGLHHVVYEAAMLVATQSALIHETDGQWRNALIESYALHDRSLFEFLADANTRSDAIRLEAFDVTRPVMDPGLRDRLGRLNGYASSRVTHLSWARVTSNPGAPTGDLRLSLTSPCTMWGRLRMSLSTTRRPATSPSCGVGGRPPAPSRTRLAPPVRARPRGEGRPRGQYGNRC
jgi:hypothetical protein